MLQQGLACCEAPSDPGTFALGTARAPGTRATVAQRGPIGPHLCTEGTLSPALPSHLILHSHGKFLPPPLNPLTVCSWAQGHLHREEGIAPSGPQTTPLSALAPIESELESPHRRAVPSQKGDRTLLAGGRSVHPRGPPALPPPPPPLPPAAQEPLARLSSCALPGTHVSSPWHPPASWEVSLFPSTQGPQVPRSTVRSYGR